MAYETEYEAIEGWESESEAAEAARGIRRPSSKPSFRPRTASGPYVTEARLAAAISNVDTKIKTVSNGVSKVDSRVNSLAISIKREADERKKMTESQGKDVNQKMMMLAILPALMQPTFTTNLTSDAATGAVSTTKAGDDVTITPSTNMLSLLVPVLAVSGQGLTGSGDSDNMMMLMVVAAVAAAAQQKTP